MSYPRRSVPIDALESWFEANWAYVMPDFLGKPNHYIVEWRSNTAPVEPNRVPVNANQENADVTAGNRSQ